MHKPRAGFTLVELIVVIAIIGLISSVILASLNSVRSKGVSANVTIAMHGLQNALLMYYDDKGTWPSKTGDGRMVVANNGAGWASFLSKLSAYIPSNFYNLPYATDSGVMVQGYLYMKGTEASPVQIRMYNNSTHAYVGCIIIYEGYYFDAVVPYAQSSFTLNDGGVDPDGTS